MENKNISDNSLIKISGDVKNSAALLDRTKVFRLPPDSAVFDIETNVMTTPKTISSEFMADFLKEVATIRGQTGLSKDTLVKDINSEGVHLDGGLATIANPEALQRLSESEPLLFKPLSDSVNELRKKFNNSETKVNIKKSTLD